MPAEFVYPLLGAMVSAVGVVLVAAISAWAGRRQAQGDYAKDIAEAAVGLVEPQNKRLALVEGLLEALRKKVAQHELTIQKLGDDNTRLRKLLQIWQNGVVILINQLRDLGHEPAWVPPGTEHGETE